MDANTYFQRLTAVRKKLTEWEADGALVTGYANYRWLSGFTGSNCKLLVTLDQALLATDFRYYEQAKQQSPHFTLFKHERRADDDKAFLDQAGATKIVVDACNISLDEFRKLKKLDDTIQWQPREHSIEFLRAIKTAAEIEKIKAAATITDFAMSQVNEIIRPGMKESEIAWELEKTMRNAGASGMAFDVLVASGPNSALPHHRAGDRQVQVGDAIIIDMGAMLDGYRSDLTRSFYLGSEPSDKFKEIFDIVQAAQTAVLQQAKPGMSCKSVDSIARDLIGEAGHHEHFGHGLGHGLGLDIHEEPFLSQRATDDKTIEVGMTLTVEPGIYIPSWGGIRIEDLTIIGENGLEVISHCPKNPIIPV
ncbi:MAG: aminopeptidase P family protein [Chloroflexota bacterium]